MIGVLSAIFAASIGTLVINWLIVRNAVRYQIIDEPTESRQLHKEATPTAGGVALFGGTVLGVIILTLFGTEPEIVRAPLFWVGAGLVITAGLWDDLIGLNVKAKFLLQLVAAYCLLYTGAHFEIAGLWGVKVATFNRALVAIPLSIVWIVGIINAINLVDGLDGLASGVTGIAFISSAVLFGIHGYMSLMYIGIVIAAALATFLLHNFKPASIFMGDTGSLFLGYVLAAYLLQVPLHSDPALALLIPVVILGFPILDMTVAIVRRLIGQRSVFAPDRDHLHHKLSESSSEQWATLVLYVVSGWFGTAAILMALLPASGAYVIGVCTAVISLTWAWRRGGFRSTSEDDWRPATPERTILSPQSSGDGSPAAKPVGGQSAEKGVLKDEFDAGEVRVSG